LNGHGLLLFRLKLFGSGKRQNPPRIFPWRVN